VHEGASKQERTMTIESEKGSEKEGRRRRQNGKKRMKTVIYTITYLYISKITRPYLIRATTRIMTLIK
jgi:hypothetical protein